MYSLKFRLSSAFFLFLCATSTQVAFAQSFREAVGYNQLVTEFGGSLATGAGIRVGLVEADEDNDPLNLNSVYFPNTTIGNLSGKTFNDMRPADGKTVLVSGHATAVAQNFFGNATSLSPGVSQIDVYEANDFVDFRQQFGTANNPELTNVSVMNHSYIGSGVPGLQASEYNARLDYTVNRDNFTSVVALNNGVGSVPELFGQSYNSIVVGRTDGLHSFGLTSVNGSNRTKPDIVTPQGSTSLATPVVSSAAALLHSAAVANSMTNARNSETMKAIIMAGATKDEFPGWSNTSTRPLDATFGAGELNVYNSYKILLGGESNGSSVQPVGSSTLRGWDYSDSITGDLYWNFITTQAISEASFLLTWNADFQILVGNISFSLANMDMRLYDSSGSFLGSQISASLSTVDNVEHIYLRNLAAGTYTLAISSNLNTSFGLAWNISVVPEPNGFLLVSLACALGLGRRRRRN